MPEHPDSFHDARTSGSILNTDFSGENVRFILGLKDVRKAAKDWQTFSSDHPFKVVPHSEEDLREIRQLPIETDPPDHTDYRKLVEPIFRKPTQDWYQEDMKALIENMVSAAIETETLDAVYSFALPLQCRALTRLLGVPESESDHWISWGIHVFHDPASGKPRGDELDAYIVDQLAKAKQNPGEDFFSVLNQIEFRGRPLTHDEKRGFANLAFAGGRDTIINTVSSIIVYLGENPDALEFLRQDPMHLITATEEFIRYVSPVTAIARTCPHVAKVAEADIPAGTRVGLCWPSANRDASIFKDANNVVLDRKPNPHVAFGFGAHNCLGAPHARLIIRSLLQTLCDKIDRIEIIDTTAKLEEEVSFTRKVGYESANVRFIPKS